MLVMTMVGFLNSYLLFNNFIYMPATHTWFLFLLYMTPVCPETINTTLTHVNQFIITSSTAGDIRFIYQY